MAANALHNTAAPAAPLPGAGGGVALVGCPLLLKIQVRLLGLGWEGMQGKETLNGFLGRFSPIFHKLVGNLQHTLGEYTPNNAGLPRRWVF